MDRFAMGQRASSVAGMGSALAALAFFPALAAPPTANAEGVYDFTLPSRNVECVYVPAGGTSVYKPPRGEAELSCDRAEPSYVHLSLPARGPAVLVKDPGERGCCIASPVLDYGESLRMGPFACRSARDGLTCRRDDGPGFFVSRARVETFPPAP